MNVDIHSRAHRTLKALSWYSDLSGDGKLPPGAPQPPVLQPDDVPIGAYVNGPTGFSDLVLFTTNGIYVYRSDKWEEAKYRDINRTIAPESKEAVTGFNMLLQDGRNFWLPITGSKSGRFFDAFEVLRFVDRVVADIASFK
jgi:hypothetical protein